MSAEATRSCLPWPLPEGDRPGADPEGVSRSRRAPPMVESGGRTAVTCKKHTQTRLEQAEEQLRLLMRPVGKRDCAGKARGPAMDPTKLKQIAELEERIAQLKAKLNA